MLARKQIGETSKSSGVYSPKCQHSDLLMKARAIDAGAIDAGVIDVGAIDTGAIDTGAIDTVL